MHRLLPIVACVAVGCATPPKESAPELVPTQAPLRVLQAPQPFRDAGGWHLALEIVAPSGDTLTALTVRHGAVVHTLADEKLAAACVGLHTSADRASGLRREPGATPGDQGTAVFVWTTVPSREALPESLAVEALFASGARHSLQVPVAPAETLLVQPPVLGPGWFTFMAPSNTSSHRRSIHTADGTLHAPQRFAVDLVRTDQSGARFTGSPAVNANYTAYGSPVVAVGGGVVVAVRDGIPENTPGLCPDRGNDPTCCVKAAVPITADTLAGNYVLVGLDSGAHATYAHLVPGSIEVTVGERVTGGQTLGRVGNSGHSSEPHLHFHLCDGPSVMGCGGVPFHFARFVEIPVDPRRGPTGPPRVMQTATPSNSSVLILPDANGQISGPSQ
jgi:murein DD-endopeptidase MepM/ murein hydrolase activator NlpD